MIVLESTTQLRAVFDKLIGMLPVPVEWNGHFIVLDNFLVLKGRERSVIFNFDAKKVGTNILDIDDTRTEAVDIADNTLITNILNLVLYTFGKWGALKGVTVEKDLGQINTLLQRVYGELNIKPDYSMEHCYLYKDGARITYEDAIALAVEKKNFVSGNAGEDDNADAGLWHSMVWQAMEDDFILNKTTLEERKRGRLGNNFYKVGYLCPHCQEKMYMIVFKEQQEPVIDTSEGRVRLARAFTCPQCFTYYTPLPKRNLAEGEAYLLDFEGDRVAYEDYMELLGRQGTREPNSSFNEYVDRAPEREQYNERVDLNGIDKGIRDERIDLNGIDKGIRDERIDLNGIDKGIRDERIDLNGIDKGIRDERIDLNGIDKGIHDDRIDLNGIDKFDEICRAEEGFYPDEYVKEKESEYSTFWQKEEEQRKLRTMGERHKDNGTYDSEGKEADSTDMPEAVDTAEYEKRIEMYDRLSDRQVEQLKKSIEQDKRLPDNERQTLVDKLRKAQLRHNDEVLSRKVENVKGKSYAALENLEEQVAQADVTPELKKKLLECVREAKKESAAAEIKKMMQKLPETLDRRGYELYHKSLGCYKNTDISIYERELYARRQKGERREASDILQRAKRSTRNDLTELKKIIENRNFSKEVEKEYTDRVYEAIRKLDTRRMDEACGDYMNYTGEELEQLYADIGNETFLPEIKDDALAKVEKRLKKIKTDECGLLVRRLKKELEENNVAENKRHYFYPAAQKPDNTADSEILEHINYAKATYAAQAGRFEYPVIMVDTTHGNTGKEGMIITPEAVYYSSFITCGRIGIDEIKSVEANTGLIGRSVMVYTEDDRKIKLPYAVDSKELKGYTQALNSFVAYLKERPFSRKEKYLAKEKHDVICCFRCGYIYKDYKECPKCGYKTNR